MKQSLVGAIRTSFLFMLFIFWTAIAFAQDKIVIDKSQAESWLMRNWIWVALGALVLLILLFSGTSAARRRRTTTVTRDNLSNVRKVTTTEVDD